MKNKLFVFLFLISIGLQAHVPQLSAQKNCKVIQANIQFDVQANSSAAIEKWIVQNQLSAIQGQSVTLISFKVGFESKHFLFQQTYQNLPVFAADIKVNTTNSGQLLQAFSNLYVVKEAINTSWSKANCWFVDADKMIPAFQQKQKDENGIWQEIVSNENGTTLLIKQLDLMNKQDTLVSTKLFTPDPLTTAQKAYGADNGLWANKNGTDYTEINAQRKSVQLPIRFENDTFYAENKHAIIVELESPVIAPFKSKAANFEFTRAQPTFREFMALFHIANLQNYLHSIQIDSFANFQILIDAHAYQGRDQSRFSLTGADQPALFFGTGGVPDAEDADVVIHEYSHGISHSITPNTSSGLERMALEEANCDFMACQYSKSFSEYNWRQVFNWDGHNEYWEGRNAASNKTYPSAVSSNYYSTSELWSSMMNDISLDLGREVATKILFYSMYNYANSMGLQEAADLLVQTDSLLYQKAHFGPLKQRLIERGFAVSMAVPFLSARPDLKLLNTTGFANGTGHISVQQSVNSPIKLSVYGMNGALIKVTDWNQHPELSPADFATGIYFVKVETEAGSFIEKVMRLY